MRISTKTKSYIASMQSKAMWDYFPKNFKPAPKEVYSLDVPGFEDEVTKDESIVNKNTEHPNSNEDNDIFIEKTWL